MTKNASKFHFLIEYGRTVAISFGVALIFTLLLSVHARNEMIKNLYASPSGRLQIDEKIARQIIVQSDLTKDLNTKKYAVCMQVGNLYEMAHDYPNAQLAYELAVDKAKAGVYRPYQRLASVLIAQNKLKEAQNLLDSVSDVKNKQLIKFKTRAYIEMGDKLYSHGKFLSAAKSYEKASFYYKRFAKRDKKVDESINIRIVNAYLETANIMVKNGYNSDAVRFLKKAKKYDKDNFEIRYKLAIVYSDLNPIKSVKYFEPLLEEMPQRIDYGVFTKALMKAANIADLEGKPTLAKYYRYKIHSVDLFVEQKVVYPNDVEILLTSFNVRKILFKYKLRAIYKFKNASNKNINKLYAEFILKQNDKILETITKEVVNRNKPLVINGGKSGDVNVTFGKKIFTKKELEQYYIDIYLYKDEKYKTLVSSTKVPLKSFSQ